MTEPQSDRWQILLVVAFIAMVGSGVYYANRSASSLEPFELGETDAKEVTGAAKRLPIAAKSRTATGRGSTEPRDKVASPEKSQPRVRIATEAERFCAKAGAASRPDKVDVTEYSLLGPILRLAAIARTDALNRLKTVPHTALSLGYMSFFLFESGDDHLGEATLSTARQILPGRLCVKALSDPKLSSLDSPIVASLHTLRLATEAALMTTDADILFCDIFLSHGTDAIAAFGPTWMNERDSLGASIKRYCVSELLDQYAPGTSKRTSRALDSLCTALPNSPAHEDAGSRRTRHLSACGLIVDAILENEDFEFILAHSGFGGFDQWTHQTRANDEAIAEFQKTSVKLAPIIGEAMCHLKAARGMPYSAQRCDERALRAINDSLVFWLTTPYQRDTMRLRMPPPLNIPIDD